MTYKEQIAAACEDVVGSSNMGNELEMCLQSALGRKPDHEDFKAAAKYMADEGISVCESCGWWHDNLGDSLCYDCLNDLKEIELEDD